MGHLYDGIAELQRVHKEGEGTYIGHIIGRDAVPVIGGDVDGSRQGGVEAAQAGN